MTDPKEEDFFRKLGISGTKEECEKIGKIIVEENGEVIVERYM